MAVIYDRAMMWHFWNQRRKGGGAGGSFSPESQSVIDRMSALTSAQETAVATFVDALVTSGNWPLIDELYCLKSNSTDWLKGFKSKTGTNGGDAVFSSNGSVFDGTANSYIDLGWNPAVDGVNWTLDDAGVSIYVHTWADTVLTAQALGLRIGSDEITIKKGNTTDNYANALNSPPDLETSAVTPYGDDMLITVSRQNSSTLISTHINGAGELTEFENSVGIPNGNIFIGAQNFANSAIQNNWEGTIGLVAFHAGAAFDEASFNTDVRAFLAAI